MLSILLRNIEREQPKNRRKSRARKRKGPPETLIRGASTPKESHRQMAQHPAAVADLHCDLRRDVWQM
jgi:hypothetical protein